MNFLKIKLLVIAVIMFAASSAFASLSYDVTVNTSSLNGQSGYLYLQYATTSSVASTATVSSFVTDGVLGAQDTVDVVNGSAVTGTLPGSVVFANTNPVNDYNQAITLGNSLSFLVTFASAPAANTGSAVSTLSLGLFADPYGNTALLGLNSAVPGTVAMISLNNDGSTSTQLDSTVSATPTPIPAAFLLFGSGLAGLVGIRRKKPNSIQSWVVECHRP